MEINKTLNISLRSVAPASIEQADKTEFSFPRFSDVSDMPDSSISIIRNKSNGHLLLRRFPNFDYIAAVFTESGKHSPEEFASKLRSVQHISAVFLIDTKNIEPVIMEAIIPY